MYKFYVTDITEGMLERDFFTALRTSSDYRMCRVGYRVELFFILETSSLPFFTHKNLSITHIHSLFCATDKIQRANTMSAIKIIDMTIPSVWEEEDTVMMNDEEFSSVSSYDEANIVFEQWQNTDFDDLDIMEVDEQIGSNLLFNDDEIFVSDPCVSPTGPLEELTMLKFEEEDLDRFSLAFLDFNDESPTTTYDGDMNGTTKPLPFEERYKSTLSKLAESMKRSQETRKSLQMKTTKTTNYQRSNSVTGVISSIEMSSQQLQVYLKSIRQA